MARDGNGKADGIPLLKCFGTVWLGKIKENINEILNKDKTKNTGVSIPQREQNNANKRKPEAKNKIIRTKKRIFYEYEPTNIGYVFDSEYWRWKRIKSDWKCYYGEEEDLNLKDILKYL